MALQALPSALIYPNLVQHISAALAIATSTTLNASGDYEAVVAYARESMSITHVGFYPPAATGSPTAEVRIETVDASTGMPTGTLFGTNANGTSGTLVAATWTLVALTASVSITAGQAYAIVVKYASGTSFTTALINTYSLRYSTPYEVDNSTGTPAKAIAAAQLMAVGSSTSAFYAVAGILPVKSIGGGTFNNTSGARRAARFQVPFKCRVAGLRVYLGTQSGDINIAIYDDAGAEVDSSNTAIDGNQLGNIASGNNLFFDSPATLSPATWYRASVEPSSATNSEIRTLTLPHADYRSAMPGGTNWHYATYASSAWTDTATDQVPLIDLLIDQLDDGIGATSIPLSRPTIMWE